MLILSSQSVVKSNKAFTLIELIIVIMIISLVVFLVFSEAVKETKKPKKLGVLTLPSTLQQKFGLYQDIEFFCINENHNCFIAKNDGSIISYKDSIDLGKNLEIYKVDKDNKLFQIDEFGRIKDNKISFRYRLYSGGVVEQVILSNNKGVYYIPSYFGEPIEVKDIEEAKELWIQSKYDLKDSANYY